MARADAARHRALAPRRERRPFTRHLAFTDASCTLKQSRQTHAAADFSCALRTAPRARAVAALDRAIGPRRPLSNSAVARTAGHIALIRLLQHRTGRATTCRSDDRCARTCSSRYCRVVSTRRRAGAPRSEGIDATVARTAGGAWAGAHAIGGAELARCANAATTTRFVQASVSGCRHAFSSTGV